MFYITALERGSPSLYYASLGEVSEWLKEPVSKTGKVLRPSRVRIPPSPFPSNDLRHSRLACTGSVGHRIGHKKMPQNINSAYRVYQILQKAAQQDPGRATGWIWANVFGYGKGEPEQTDELSTRDTDVARALALLRDEIINARDQMLATDLSNDLYEDAFGGALKAISASSLRTGWSDFRQHLTQDRLLAIRFCSEVLPDQERLIDKKDLDDIEAQLASLRATIDERDLPADVRRFILGLVRTIERAIKDYPVSGAKAYRNAFVDAVASYGENEILIQENKGVSEMKTLDRIWKKFTDVTQKAETIQKFLKAASGFSSFLGLPPGD